MKNGPQKMRSFTPIVPQSVHAHAAQKSLQFLGNVVNVTMSSAR
jgi:hypothetical protein